MVATPKTFPSGTGTRTPVSCVKGKYDNHLHHAGMWPHKRTTPVRQPRIKLGAQRWQRWILPLNHWHLVSEVKRAFMMYLSLEQHAQNLRLRAARKAHSSQQSSQVCVYAMPMLPLFSKIRFVNYEQLIVKW